MATTIVTKKGSGAPAASDLVEGELAVDTTNGRLYTENSSAAVVELGSNPSGNITFGDNGKAIFGAGSDLQIYHDGSHSYVTDAGTGNLNIQSNGVGVVIAHTDGTDLAVFNSGNGSVSLYNSGNLKLATTSTGIDVTGSISADGLTVDGAATITVTDNSDTLTLVSTDADANVGPVLNLFRNSASPADNDLIGRIVFKGDDSAGNAATYARIETIATDVTNGSEDGRLDFYTAKDDAFSAAMSISGTNVGIGTSSPSTILDINTTGTGVNIQAGNAASDIALGIGSPSTANKVVVTAGGNVGIGTTSPSTYDSRSNNLVVGDSGDSGITIFSGATSNARLQFAPSGDTGLNNGLIDYDNNDDSMAFATGGTERMRIDSTGQLLLGTTENVFGGADRYGYNFYANGQSNQSIDGTGGAVAQYINLENADGQYMSFYKDRAAVGSIGANSGVAYIVLNDATSDNVAALKGAGGAILPSTNAGADKDGTMSLGSSGARFASLYLSGIANIGGTANFASWSNSGASNGIEIRSADAQILNSHTGTATHVYQYFYNANGIVGSISASGSSTAYNTSSDYRLKENVVAMSGATERLKQLKPSRFNFIADADTTVDGFLAHEVQDIVPEAITGAKDAVDEDGNPEYQGIDQSKLVPLLVATIQELEARIAALES